MVDEVCHDDEMGNGRRIFLVAAMVAAVGGISWVLWRSHEPVYQGKTLDYWLTGYNSQNYHLAHPDAPTKGQADEAIRQMGTNATPGLLRRLRKRESKAKATVVRLLQKQQFVKISYTPTTEFWNGFFGLQALGSTASNAVPQLVGIFEKDASPFTQVAVPVILGGIGPAANRAVPAMMRGITHTNALVRIDAIYALRRIHPEPKLVLPALIKSLKDPDAMVRAQAARSLGEYCKDAEPAVPPLLELWRNEQPSRTGGGGTVSNEGWAVAAVWIKGWPAMGSLNAPDVASFAKKAVQAIDPEAAEKAGVK